MPPPSIGPSSPLEVLQARFGFSELRPGQAAVVDAVLGHGAALAVFPTGAGKSLCYQLPALLLDGVTLVVSPLIALMKDQIDFLRGLGIHAGRLDSSLSASEARAVADDLRSGTLKLLYVAPERFNNERFLETLARAKIALFAVDEAHCISEWGHNFRPDYLKLAGFRARLGNPRVLALTATATPEVVKDICRAFAIPDEAAIVTGFYRPNLRLVTTPVSAAERDGLLLERLAGGAHGPTIVYVTLQRTAERLAETLTRAGSPAAAYHAGMDPEARARVQDAWMASEQGIVVATIAFGMGIDKANVRTVIHYNLPKSLESYSQEIGRAGRDGAPSLVELFACPDDVAGLQNFAYGDTPTEGSLRSLLTQVLGMGAAFDVSYPELSGQHDLRVLVLRTALTYLELDGVLAQGTPFYAAYTLRPVVPLDEIPGRFAAERRELVTRLLSQATKRRTLYSLDPTAAAAAIGEPRERVLTALTYFEEQGWLALEPADVRQPYRRLREREDVDALVADLVRRFERRERSEIERIEAVLRIVTHAGCQTNALVGHFGQVRAGPCGHCSGCSGTPRTLPEERALPPVPRDLRAGLGALRAKHPRALAEPRQVARFLCGLTSPALTREKLSRHPWFGVLAERRFADVLAFVGAPAMAWEAGA
ncbi:MAG TPA: ATP-dependent DNA helicase RecQ [Polyangiaceae bacterium]|nr:ATP-dependent DNA helicase RecQ [Polyangiaceae bacterium]